MREVRNVVTVNGMTRTLAEDKRMLSYEEVCTLAGIDPARNPSVTFSGDYENLQVSGSATRGSYVPVYNHMVINAFVTGNA